MAANTIELKISVKDDGTAVLQSFAADATKAMGGAVEASEKAVGAFSSLGSAAVVLNQGLELVKKGFDFGREVLDFTESIGANAVAITNAAAATGLAAETYQGLSAAFTDAGQPAGTLDAAMRQLNQQVQAASSGNADAIRLFNDLGISTKKLASVSGDSEAALRMVSDALGNYANDGQKAATMNDLLGRSGNALVLTMGSGTAAIDAATAAAKEQGRVISDETLAAQRALDDQVTALKGNVEGLTSGLKADLTPALAEITGGLLGWVEQNKALIAQDLKGFVGGAAEAFRIAAPAVTALAGAIGDVISAVGTLTGISALVDWMRSASKETKELEDRNRSLAESFDPVTKAWADAAANGHALEDSLAAVRAEIAQGEAAGQGYGGELDNLRTRELNLTEAIAANAAKMTSAQTAMSSAGRTVADLGGTIVEAAADMSEFAPALQRTSGAADAAKKSADELAQSIAGIELGNLSKEVDASIQAVGTTFGDTSAEVQAAMDLIDERLGTAIDDAILFGRSAEETGAMIDSAYADAAKATAALGDANAQAAQGVQQASDALDQMAAAAAQASASLDLQAFDADLSTWLDTTAQLIPASDALAQGTAKLQARFELARQAAMKLDATSQKMILTEDDARKIALEEAEAVKQLGRQLGTTAIISQQAAEMVGQAWSQDLATAITSGDFSDIGTKLGADLMRGINDILAQSLERSIMRPIEDALTGAFKIGMDAVEGILNSAVKSIGSSISESFSGGTKAASDAGQSAAESWTDGLTKDLQSASLKGLVSAAVSGIVGGIVVGLESASDAIGDFFMGPSMETELRLKFEGLVSDALTSADFESAVTAAFADIDVTIGAAFGKLLEESARAAVDAIAAAGTNVNLDAELAKAATSLHVGSDEFIAALGSAVDSTQSAVEKFLAQSVAQQLALSEQAAGNLAIGPDSQVFIEQTTKQIIAAGNAVVGPGQALVDWLQALADESGAPDELTAALFQLNGALGKTAAGQTFFDTFNSAISSLSGKDLSDAAGNLNDLFNESGLSAQQFADVLNQALASAPPEVQAIVADLGGLVDGLGDVTGATDAMASAVNDSIDQALKNFGLFGAAPKIVEDANKQVMESFSAMSQQIASDGEASAKEIQTFMAEIVAAVTALGPNLTEQSKAALGDMIVNLGELSGTSIKDLISASGQAGTAVGDDLQSMADAALGVSDAVDGIGTSFAELAASTNATVGEALADFGRLKGDIEAGNQAIADSIGTTITTAFKNEFETILSDGAFSAQELAALFAEMNEATASGAADAIPAVQSAFDEMLAAIETTTNLTEQQIRDLVDQFATGVIGVDEFNAAIAAAGGTIADIPPLPPVEPPPIKPIEDATTASLALDDAAKQFSTSIGASATDAATLAPSLASAAAAVAPVADQALAMTDAFTASGQTAQAFADSIGSSAAQFGSLNQAVLDALPPVNTAIDKTTTQYVAPLTDQVDATTASAGDMEDALLQAARDALLPTQDLTGAMTDLLAQVEAVVVDRSFTVTVVVDDSALAALEDRMRADGIEVGGGGGEPPPAEGGGGPAAVTRAPGGAGTATSTPTSGASARVSVSAAPVEMVTVSIPATTYARLKRGILVEGLPAAFKTGDLQWDEVRKRPVRGGMRP